ncbi:D-2-hydroxyacid dehydrogenase [Sulfurovum sp. zt1-1]|uniref:D-2-hydroxyacid dehydrogenase n=1 Tax=Sulfurovum zhangzhouensis TaxID=3019067 RepID=A0ABT7QZZ3_9BACT|nr:D-2-hydroxyacid dehydrogenase [Sulfurovum zhangzhouensis]MDM5272347.1 D-2-hydroxyacid dehydrogenase [Sulfurovum zhangzhouensis]
MNIVILDAKTLGNDLDLSVLDQFGKVVRYETTDPSETYERIRNATIVITNKVVISKLHMQRCPLLKLICIAATGTNNVDLDAAAQIGIKVKNVAGYSTQSVVQHTFAMALYLLEKMAYYDNSVKSQEWSRSGLFTDVSHPFFEIAGKNWGIIGLGEIGKGVAQVAEAFGAKVSYYSTSGKNTDTCYTQQSLEELLSTCEIISIHAPLNEQTKNLINAENLKLLKEESILINVGRGGIINEADLAKELDSRTIYAGLDVVEKEPIPTDNPLLHIEAQERLLITPHIAWTSKEARVKLLEGIVGNISTFLNKELS